MWIVFSIALYIIFAIFVGTFIQLNYDFSYIKILDLHKIAIDQNIKEGLGVLISIFWPISIPIIILIIGVYLFSTKIVTYPYNCITKSIKRKRNKNEI